MPHADLAIIGAGPGGYTAAEAAGRAGLSVVLFEKDQLGGTCLNRGCVPTKALLHSAETFASVTGSKRLGVEATGGDLDFATMHSHKDDVVGVLQRGISKLMRSARVTVVEGEATIIGTPEHPAPAAAPDADPAAAPDPTGDPAAPDEPPTAAPAATDPADAPDAPHFTISCGEDAWTATDVIIATGSVPAMPPIEGLDLPGVHTSDDILCNGGINAESIVIIGGGVIGVEIGGIYAALGRSVTIIEALPRILPGLDKDVSSRVAAELKRREVNVQPKCSVRDIETDSFGKLVVSFNNKHEELKQVRTRCVLVATGRRAMTGGLFAEGCEPELDRGAVVADENGATSIAHMWVIGDAKAGNIQLAHVAEAQARNTVAAITGSEPPVDMSVVPNCVYTNPEVACVGMSEAEAKEAGIKTKSAKALAGANAKCLIEDCAGGYVKLVARADDGVLIGAQLVYPRATDLVSELSLAISQGLTAAQLASVIHPHPTFSEAVMEAAAKL